MRPRVSPRLLATNRKRDQARAMLAEIYDWFTEGFDTVDLEDAKAQARTTRRVTPPTAESSRTGNSIPGSGNFLRITGNRIEVDPTGVDHVGRH